MCYLSIGTYKSTYGSTFDIYHNIWASKDGRYVFLEREVASGSYRTYYHWIWCINNGIPSIYTEFESLYVTYLEGLDKIIHGGSNGSLIKLSSITQGDTAPTITKEKTITLVNTNSEGLAYGGLFASPDNTSLIVASKSTTNSFVYIFDLAEILSSSYTELIATELYEFPANGYSSKWYIYSNLEGTKILILGHNRTYDEEDVSIAKCFLMSLSTEINSNNLIGIIYKGTYFSNINKYSLSATSSDVLAGKTFIGKNGTVETGVLEIETTETSETSEEG